MKFFVSLILMALLSFVACLYLPWWSIAVCCFIVSVAFRQSSGRSFSAGFLALLLLWGGLSIWISTQNDHLLARKMSAVIFKSSNEWLMILVTAFIGALIGGLSAWAGGFVWPRVNRSKLHSRPWKLNETITPGSIPVPLRLFKCAKSFWYCVYW